MRAPIEIAHDMSAADVEAVEQRRRVAGHLLRRVSRRLVALRRRAVAAIVEGDRR